MCNLGSIFLQLSLFRSNKLKNQYPIDLFNSFVARLRSANAHLFVERSSEDHDEFHVCDEHCLY